MTRYLLDTSVWIRFLRGNREIRTRIEGLLARGDQVVSCGFVGMELLAGVNGRNAAVVEKLVDDLRDLRFDEHQDFETAARLNVAARRHGLAVRSLVDCLIASIVLRQDDVVLAHCDGDFDRLARVSTLRTERWDAAA